MANLHLALVSTMQVTCSLPSSAAPQQLQWFMSLYESVENSGNQRRSYPRCLCSSFLPSQVCHLSNLFHFLKLFCVLGGILYFSWTMLRSYSFPYEKDVFTHHEQCELTIFPFLMDVFLLPAVILNINKWFYFRLRVRR